MSARPVAAFTPARNRATTSFKPGLRCAADSKKNLDEAPPRRWAIPRLCSYDVVALIAEIRSFMNAISAALSVRSIAARKAASAWSV
jgi:hypothetical protein